MPLKSSRAVGRSQERGAEPQSHTPSLGLPPSGSGSWETYKLSQCSLGKRVSQTEHVWPEVPFDRREDTSPPPTLLFLPNSVYPWLINCPLASG